MVLNRGEDKLQSCWRGCKLLCMREMTCWGERVCFGGQEWGWEESMKKQNYQIMSKSACKRCQIPFCRGFFKNAKGLGISFQATFFVEYFDKTFFCNITLTGQMPLTTSAYFPTYSVKCISCIF